MLRSLGSPIQVMKSHAQRFVSYRRAVPPGVIQRVKNSTLPELFIKGVGYITIGL